MPRPKWRGCGMPTLTIDGRQISSPDGSTVIQAAETLGIFVPRYCYHPGLSIAGNCRICLIEVEKNPKLQIACNTPVAEGMVVHTQSEKAEDGRRAVLEFLLANHPLDCPVCDQSGECDLQNFYMNFGLYDPRFREQKVKKKKAVAVGPHVMLDQERCILCSRCVRFTDEISKTGEFGIFNRGDRSEVGLYPGQELNNPYSGNVIDVCPVGALTDHDFRFKARVWYLSSAPTVCDGCAQGCNIDVHYVPDRPHLNGGARVLRLKPRYNAEVNQWWMCDEGRFGFHWMDHQRLTKVRHLGTDSTWEQAVAAITAALTRFRGNAAGSRLAVIASSKLSNEELFLIKDIFRGALGARVTASVPAPSGFSDDFLIKADKNPNTLGATLLGLAGPGAPDAAGIIADALQGRVEALWVFGHDLVELVGKSGLEELSRKVDLLIFSGTNENFTAAAAHWALPTAAYVEKDGTFVNCHGRVQRIGRAFPPLPDSREDWTLLLEIARQLDHPLTWRNPQEIFLAMAKAVAPFAGLTYKEIGSLGAALALSKPAEGTVAP
ncbi:MAG: 2Fe-2S iron-sulfur cluster binding domain-containing protein [Acidobacteria bacterium]|nr:2Fe-2S iron-sulfur cluster binding domain-containing protein [Acidobacteriota bacterium]